MSVATKSRAKRESEVPFWWNELAYFLCHGLFFLGAVLHALHFFACGGRGKGFFGGYENDERENHGGHGCDERVVDAGVEHVEVLGAECAEVGAGGVSGG